MHFEVNNFIQKFTEITLIETDATCSIEIVVFLPLLKITSPLRRNKLLYTRSTNLQPIHENKYSKIKITGEVACYIRPFQRLLDQTTDFTNRFLPYRLISAALLILFLNCE